MCPGQESRHHDQRGDWEFDAHGGALRWTSGRERPDGGRGCLSGRVGSAVSGPERPWGHRCSGYLICVAVPVFGVLMPSSRKQPFVVFRTKVLKGRKADICCKSIKSVWNEKERLLTLRRRRGLLATIRSMNFETANVFMYSSVLIEGVVFTVNAFVPLKNSL